MMSKSERLDGERIPEGLARTGEATPVSTERGGLGWI